MAFLDRLAQRPLPQRLAVLAGAFAVAFGVAVLLAPFFGIDALVLYLLPIFLAALLLRPMGILLFALASYPLAHAYAALVGVPPNQPSEMLLRLTVATTGALAVHYLWRDRQSLASRQALDARLAAIVASSDDAILSKRADGTITTWNDAATRMYGWTAQEMVGDNVRRLLPPERVEEEGGVLARVAGGERVDHFETERVTKDGRRLRVSLSVAPILDASGRIAGMSAIHRDVTRERQQQEALHHNDKLTALGTLVAGVAHEINNPLTYMRGNVELARDELADALKSDDVASKDRALAEARERLEPVLRGIERVEHITRSLRHIARKNGSERHAVDLVAVVESVLVVAKPRVPDHVRVEAALAPLPPVLANESELSQVVLNLVFNALDAVEKVERPVVRIETAHAGGFALLVVEDNGPGVPDELRPRLFTPFFTTKPHGTGLGLSISHQIAASHGGALTLVTRPGATRFELRLPLAPSR